MSEEIRGMLIAGDLAAILARPFQCYTSLTAGRLEAICAFRSLLYAGTRADIILRLQEDDIHNFHNKSTDCLEMFLQVGRAGEA